MPRAYVHFEDWMIFNIERGTHIISVPCLSAYGAGPLSTRPPGSELNRPPISSQNAAVICGGSTQVQAVIKDTLLQLKQNQKAYKRNVVLSDHIFALFFL